MINLKQLLAEAYDKTDKTVFAAKFGNDREQLHKLSDHKDSYIRAYVANNPNVHPDTLHKMITNPVHPINYQDEHWDIPKHIACNPNTHPDTLHHIAKHGSWDAKEAIAVNPKTSPKTLEHLNTSDPHFDYDLVQHPNASPKLLHDAALNNLHIGEKSTVLQRVVKHPNVSAQTLKLIKQHLNSSK